jgi:hypothetical protein
MRTLSAFLLSLSAVLPAGAAGQGLEASFGEAGLSGLRYGGHDFLKSGAPEGMIVFLETVGKDKDGYRSWSFEKAEGAP